MQNQNMEAVVFEAQGQAGKGPEMTTEEMNQLDRQVAELMGLVFVGDGSGFNRANPPYIYVKAGMGLFYVPVGGECIGWQPTRDPLCERVVVEWARSQSYLVTFAFCANGDFVVGILNAYGKRVGASSVPPDTPGIALCLAVVEMFGGKA